jgi:predicted Zn finger-like uncharacterized protein
MRLVCPNCVAQYEVADGTIPDSGRDVQCANCNHIWFQDAAFKLSTDDLTHVPTKLHSTYDDDEDEDEGPGVFHSMRANRVPDTSTDAAERTLPEVGNNVLDILRSEAAFSSRRRAASRVEADAPHLEPEKNTPDDDGVKFTYRQIGTRADDMAPPQESKKEEPETAEPEIAHRATDDRAEEPAANAPEADFRKLNWRHMNSSQPSGGWEPAGPDSAAFLQEDPEPEPDVTTGLAADEAKRIAEAAVAGIEPAGRLRKQDESPPVTAEEAAEQDREFRQAIRRVSVRSLADPAPAPAEQEEEEATVTSSRDMIRQMPKAADLRAEAHEDELVEDTVADEVHAATVVADDILPENAAELAEVEAEEEFLEEAHAGPDTETDLQEDDIDDDTSDEAEEADEAEPSPTVIDDPDDIRQVRRSLVENRKVLLPDVDELNTSLRMENSGHGVDLRSSAFTEEDIANRNRFWLGLVTALMLFGILWALYLMGPAISDTFPAADPYVVAYRDMANSALDATAKAWVPVVDWLESL